MGKFAGVGKHTARLILPPYMAQGAVGALTLHKPNSLTNSSQFPTLTSLTQNSTEKLRTPTSNNYTGFLSGSGQVSYSTNSQAPSAYMATGGLEYPYVAVWNQTSTDVWSAMSVDAPGLSEFPGGIYGIALSPDGTYLVACGNGTPYLAAWKRSGSTYTRLSQSNFSSIPASNYAVAFGGDGLQLAVGGGTSPYIHTYTLDTSTDVFTKNSAPATPPAGSVWDVAYNRTGTGSTASTVLITASSTTPYLNVFTVSGSTYTKIANPVTLPSSACYVCGINGAGTQMLIAQTATPYVYLYTLSAGVLTNSAFTAAVSAAPAKIAYNWAGTRVGISYNSGTNNSIYNISGSTYTSQTITYTGTLASLSSGAANGGISWSDNDTYYTVLRNGFPYIMRYSVSSNTFTTTSIPPSTGLIDQSNVFSTGSGVYSARWNSDASKLAVSSVANSQHTVFSNSSGTLTKLTTGLSTQSSSCYDIDWGGSNLLSFGQGVSPYIKNYSYTGTTFTLLSNPASLPAGVPYSLRYNPAGTILTLGMNTTPYVFSYSISGTTYTAISNPATIPTGIVYSVSWNSAGTLLACAGATSPYINIYSVSGTTFTKLTNPVALPAGTCYACALSPDGTLLAVAQSGSVYMYSINGSTVTQVMGATTTGYQVIGGLKWSKDSKVLVMYGNYSSGNQKRSQTSTLSFWVYNNGAIINIPANADYELFAPPNQYYKNDFYDDTTFTAVGFGV